MHNLKYLLSLCTLLLIAGCSSLTTQADYGAAKSRGSSDLIVPPGLSAPDSNSTYKMLSTGDLNDGYQLNKISDMQIIQGGSERWLVVKNKSANQVWQMMIAFLNQQGINIKYRNQTVGLIQTGWVAKDTVMPETGVRAFFEWAGMGSQYSLDAKFMFRVNIWQNGSDTQVFVTNYEMDEVYPNCVRNLNQNIKVAPSDAQATKWMPLPPNPQMELSFLTQFMAFAGLSPEEVKQVVVQAEAQESATPQAVVMGSTLVIDDQFDRAWWRTGIALERAGLGITDKDRSLGEYYVYPLLANIDNPDPGFFDRWFGSDKSKLEMPKAKYTIKLVADGNKTNLTLLEYQNTPDKDFAKHQKEFLDALQIQLK